MDKKFKDLEDRVEWLEQELHILLIERDKEKGDTDEG
jgi:hypothetical protein